MTPLETLRHRARRAIGSAVDVAADRSVLLGYSRIGYLLRRNVLPGTDDPLGDLTGRVAVVTGANSGLGRATAAGLARLGAKVVLVVRDDSRGAAAAEQIARSVPGAELTLERCDVSDSDDVRRLSAELARRWTVVDVLVHNAGVLPAERFETAQGHELTLATHVLGPLLLTERLRPQLSASTDARVIWMSSGGMYTQQTPADDPEYRTGRYRGAEAYARSKRIQVTLCKVLAERYGIDGIGVHSMHPGWVDTPGIATSLPRFHRLLRPLLRDPVEGADTCYWLAAAEPPPPSGYFWHDRRTRPVHYLGKQDSSEQIRRIWNYCAGATDLPDG